MDEPRFILIDADNPPGMPAEFAELTLADRLVRSNRSCRGSRPACASISRIFGAGGQRLGRDRPEATHAIIADQRSFEARSFRSYLRVESVRQGLSFPSPRYSRLEPGKIIGYSHLTLVDGRSGSPGG